ncbi:hypothetical protein N8083_02270, partial [Candidatus Pacebacteria bacterium]|nr:hypothetical protein [Candidatus Paceibacterota bacterium]
DPKNQRYGENGDLSYWEAINEESRNQSLNGDQTPMLTSIDVQYDYIFAQEDVISLIDVIEAELEAAEALYPSCFSVHMPSSLTKKRNEAIAGIVTTELMIDKLFELQDKFDIAETPGEELDILNEYNRLRSDELIKTEEDVAQAEADLSVRLQPEISKLRGQINAGVNQCSFQEGEGGNGANVGNTVLKNTLRTSTDAELIEIAATAVGRKLLLENFDALSNSQLNVLFGSTELDSKFKNDLQAKLDSQNSGV